MPWYVCVDLYRDPNLLALWSIFMLRTAVVSYNDISTRWIQCRKARCEITFFDPPESRLKIKNVSNKIGPKFLDLHVSKNFSLIFRQ